MQDDKLSLLNWKPACRVISFPVDRRIGRIRAAANGIHTARSAREAADRWRRSLGGIERSLQKTGLSKEEVARECRQFMAAVDVELATMRSDWRLQVDRDTGGTDGAA